MTTFVICHGAWSAGWTWKKMHPLMLARGHTLITPSYTGIGERAHLLTREVDLNTHTTDVLQMLHYEDLQDIVLLGHSYGGMVATGVADRAPERIRHLVYLDAFVPRNGQSAQSLQPASEKQRLQDLANQQGDGWLVQPNPLPPDTSAEDVAWALPRRVPQPLKTLTQAIELIGAVDKLPRTYIYCNKSRPGDVFRQFYDRARQEPGWRALEMEASHNPHITCPDALMALLDGLGDLGSLGGQVRS